MNRFRATMRMTRRWLLRCWVGLVVLGGGVACAWTPLPVADDPLVRMPGTQSGQGSIAEDIGRCFNCHANYDALHEPVKTWQGSMMAQAARDPLFWAGMVVAGQDSIWALGRPNAMDLCLRCHFPKGWAEGRSDPTDVKRMTGNDYDGVHCNVCHMMVDPFCVDTAAGTREGNDWTGYWDEATTGSAAAAQVTLQKDRDLLSLLRFFNGDPFFGSNGRPVPGGYVESSGGQFFFSSEVNQKRAPFIDANAKSHSFDYSRFHRSKYYCATCHDVSNPALANLGHETEHPLPSETQSAHSYFHIERTFSEFMLSAYGQPGGAFGSGAYAPELFTTADPDNRIHRCQDCHMPFSVAKAANKKDAVLRPTESTDHPKSGMPVHDLAGGNIWIPTLLASSVPGSPNYDAFNEGVLNQGPAALTLDFLQGQPLDPATLLAAADRARDNLHAAASIQQMNYDPVTGLLQFRIVNHTGHKLLSGFPEGRRMIVQIEVEQDERTLLMINPYDETAATLKGLSTAYSPSSPPLAANEAYIDNLVYEVHPGSPDLTGEHETFHMVLSTGRYKDNRIPPLGFQAAGAAARISLPVYHGLDDPDLFTAAEYAGGYDDVAVMVPRCADHISIELVYQTTSREFVEFLRDEIKGVADSLSSPTPSGEPQAYIIQTDPFFTNLKAWGDAIWQLWDHNREVDGAKPFQMVEMEQTILWDRDGDRIPDAWELDYAPDLTVMNATSDMDLDSMIDLHEFTASTDPSRADSLLAVMTTTHESGEGFTVEWPSVSGRVYGVERSLDLQQGFLPLQLGIPATPPLNVYTDRTAIADDVFYRTRVEP